MRWNVDKIISFLTEFGERVAELELAGHIRLAFTLLAAAAVLYAAVDTALGITRLDIRKPPEKKPAARAAVAEQAGPEEYRAIIERNIFASSMTPSSSGVSRSPSDYAGEPTTVNAELMGTIAGRDGYGYAIIEEKDKKKQGLYKVGDKVGNATLREVRRNTVVLNSGGADEVLQMRTTPTDSAPQAAANAAPGQQRAMPRGSHPAYGPSASTAGLPGPSGPGGASEHPAAKEVRDMVAEGNAKPHFNAGKMDGFFIDRLKEGSALKKAGLEDGDIVQSVNDRKIENPNDIVWIQKLLISPGEKISLQVNRKGRQVSLDVN